MNTKLNDFRTLVVGDPFWEYNSGVGYKRFAQSEEHIKYFWEGYGRRAFFTKEELIEAHPNAEVVDPEAQREELPSVKQVPVGVTGDFITTDYTPGTKTTTDKKGELK